eukprot:SM000125S26053  [mRNA]  locus=s125:43591:45007:- [translate_table: standard]
MTIRTCSPEDGMLTRQFSVSQSLRDIEPPMTEKAPVSKLSPHTKECRHPLGSARIALLGLENVRLLVVPERPSGASFRVRPKVPGSKRSIAGRVGNKGRRHAPDPAVLVDEMGGDVEAPKGGSAPANTPTPIWMELPAGTGLLFPSEQAHDLTLSCVSSTLPNCEFNSLALDAVPPTTSDLVQNGRGPGAPPSHLVVLDGTWSKAKRLYHENTWLQDLPHFKLPPLQAPSDYSYIRRQPKANCMSTLESIVYALQLLEPQTEGLTSLLDAFKAMVADQEF